MTSALSPRLFGDLIKNSHDKSVEEPYALKIGEIPRIPSKGETNRLFSYLRDLEVQHFATPVAF
jgi:hypothetical protein